MDNQDLAAKFELELRRSRMAYLLSCMECVEIAIRRQTEDGAEWMNESLLPWLFDEFDKAVAAFDEYRDDLEGNGFQA